MKRQKCNTKKASAPTKANVTKAKVKSSDKDAFQILLTAKASATNLKKEEKRQKKGGNALSSKSGGRRNKRVMLHKGPAGYYVVEVLNPEGTKTGFYGQAYKQLKSNNKIANKYGVVYIGQLANSKGKPRMQSGDNHPHMGLVIKSDDDAPTTGKRIAKVLTKAVKSRSHPKTYAYTGLLNNNGEPDYLGDILIMDDAIEASLRLLPSLSAAELAENLTALNILFGDDKHKVTDAIQRLLNISSNDTDGSACDTDSDNSCFKNVHIEKKTAHDDDNKFIVNDSDDDSDTSYNPQNSDDDTVTLNKNDNDVDDGISTKE